MSRPLGLVLGFLADRVLGDPARFHPVAGFGQAAGAVEQRIYAPDRRRGTVFTALLVGGTFVVARLLPKGTLATAFVTWAVLGGRSLEREAQAVAALGLPAARLRLKSLVGRDTSQLDESGVARAVVESVAENTSDAVVAPLFWGGLLGVPGLAAYRAANTLDAMVGYRNERYAEFGWASARLDDGLNLLPARLAALLTVVASDDQRRTWETWQRDAADHPSPNAGPVEAAFAGALGVQLGGVNVYDGQTEDRHTLGDGPAPKPRDIDRANALARKVGWGALAVSCALAAIAGLRRGR